MAVTPCADRRLLFYAPNEQRAVKRLLVDDRRFCVRLVKWTTEAECERCELTKGKEDAG